MALLIDPPSKLIILDRASISASEIYSCWVDWVVLSDNLKFLPAFNQIGGDDLGGGLFIPVYLFLLNGWRVRPMEQSHTLIITGNLFVEGGGVPVVPTVGNFNVSVQYTVPVQAQGISTNGSDPGAIAAAVWGHADAANLASKMNIAATILRNKTVTNPVSGLMTVYADDGLTPFLTAQLYENAGETQPYRGQGAEVRGRLE